MSKRITVYQITRHGGATGPQFCGFFRTENLALERRESLTESARRYDHGGIFYSISEQTVDPETTEVES